jgi:hypothetical protein
MPTNAVMSREEKRLHMDFHGFLWIFAHVHGFSRIFTDFNGFSLFFIWNRIKYV